MAYRTARRLWEYLGQIALVHWLWTIGGGAVLTALTGGALWAFDLLPIGLRILLIVGVFLISCATILTIRKPTRQRPPTSPRPAPPTSAARTPGERAGTTDAIAAVVTSAPVVARRQLKLTLLDSKWGPPMRYADWIRVPIRLQAINNHNTAPVRINGAHLIVRAISGGQTVDLPLREWRFVNTKHQSTPIDVLLQPASQPVEIELLFEDSWAPVAPMIFDGTKLVLRIEATGCDDTVLELSWHNPLPELATFISEGTELQQSICHVTLSELQILDLRARADAWHDRVYAYLVSELPDHAGTFRAAVSESFTNLQGFVCAFVELRVKVLKALFDELRSSGS